MAGYVDQVIERAGFTRLCTAVFNASAGQGFTPDRESSKGAHHDFRALVAGTKDETLICLDGKFDNVQAPATFSVHIIRIKGSKYGISYFNDRF